MPPVQIRDMLPETYELLKESAAESKRSIAQQADYIITSYLLVQKQMREMEPAQVYDPIWGVALRKEHLPQVSRYPRQPELTKEERIAKRKAILERLESLPKIDFSKAPDPVELIREDRDHRDDWILELGRGEA